MTYSDQLVPPSMLVFSIPIAQLPLVPSLEHDLASFGHVSHPPNKRDINNLKLVLEIVNSAVTIAGGVAGILTFIRSLRPAPNTPPQQIINITIINSNGTKYQTAYDDDALLAQLLGLDTLV